MAEIDFDQLQKDSLSDFINANPEVKDKELLANLLDTQSKLICTVLSRYHKLVQNSNDQ